MPYDRDSEHPESGLTITELMVVLVLLWVVIAAVFMINSATSQMTGRTEARTIAADEVRYAIDTVRRDVRQGQEMLDASSGQSLGVFVTASPRECIFYADVDLDNSLDKVRYYVSGRSLYRQTASAATTPAVSTSTWRAFSGTRILLTHLDPTWSSPIFVYKSQGTTPMAYTSPNPLITVVGVELKSAVRSSGVTATVQSKTTASIRSEILY
jgi:type II secretory pathway component PulJ